MSKNTHEWLEAEWRETERLKRRAWELGIEIPKTSQWWFDDDEINMEAGVSREQLDTHSQYYPFEGELLPLDDLDYDIHQQYWLPLLAGLTFIYTVLGIAGGWFLWQTRNFAARQWLLLATLLIFLRLGFFATLENPEPRYVVEVFPFLSILGGIATSRSLRFLSGGRR
jgi:hypothetical protein